MNKLIPLVFLFTFCQVKLYGQEPVRLPAPAADSASKAQPVDPLPVVTAPAGKWALVNRFNTGSMFFFTGVVANGAPAFDTKFSYTTKGWGAMVFKSFELTERSKAMNYALVVLNKRFSMGKKLVISPQIGTQLNQNGSIADNTSDVLTNFAVAYKLGRYFTLSNDAVFQNLVYTHRPNWTNRVRLLYQKADLSAAVLVWDRNSVFNNPGYTTTGIDFNYSGLKLSSTMNLLIGTQAVLVLRADTPRKSGLLFFIGVTI